MITTLVRYCLAAGILMSVSGISIDQSINKLHRLVTQSQEAVTASHEQNTVRLRPSEQKAIGNYLETPALDDVYPGLKKLASSR